MARGQVRRGRVAGTRAAASAVMLAIVLSTIATAPVASAEVAVTDVSAGDEFSCAVIEDGSVWCWGYNTYGNLGDGTTTERHEPVRVTLLGGGFVTNAVAVDTGETHACALTSDGAVWCWGGNDFGQLGDGTTAERHGAVAMTASGGAAIATATGVAAGDRVSCARVSTGRALCAGWPVGDGTRKVRSRAVTVRKANGTPLTGITAVSADEHACVRTSKGEAWCWGDNGYGQLGNGAKQDRWHAVRVTKTGGRALTGVTVVDAGELHSCARTGSGAAWCWGYNAWRAIGDGTGKNRLRAVRVQKAGGGLLTGVTTADAGAHHSCARTGAQLYCWGYNGEGSLGDGTLQDRSKAVRVRSSTGIFGGAVSIDAGYRQTCARTNDGALWCWGSNERGQVGDGTTMDRRRPVLVVPVWEAPEWIRRREPRQRSRPWGFSTDRNAGLQ